MFDFGGWWDFVTGGQSPGGASTGLKAIATDTVVALPPLRAGAVFGFGYDSLHHGLGNVSDWRQGKDLRGFDFDEAQLSTISGGFLTPLAKLRSARAGFGLAGLGLGTREILRGDYEQGSLDLFSGGWAFRTLKRPRVLEDTPITKH